MAEPQQTPQLAPPDVIPVPLSVIVAAGQALGEYVTDLQRRLGAVQNALGGLQGSVDAAQPVQKGGAE